MLSVSMSVYFSSKDILKKCVCFVFISYFSNLSLSVTIIAQKFNSSHLTLRFYRVTLP